MIEDNQWITINMGEDSNKTTSSNNSESANWFSKAISKAQSIGTTMKETVTGAGGSVITTARMLTNKNYKYFVISFLIGCFLVFLSILLLPMSIVAPQKFCLLFSLGTLSITISFAFLRDTAEYLTTLFSQNHILYTSLYILSEVFCIYACLIAKSYLYSILGIIFQGLALSALVAGIFPHGRDAIFSLLSCIFTTLRSCFTRYFS